MKRNRLVELAHFLKSYFSPYPSYLIYFITAACNARCKHCFYWREIAAADTRLELKLDEIEKLAKSLDLIYLSIGGGEPFLRSDLAEVVEKFYEHSGLLYLNVVTNGFYTERIVKIVERLLASCPTLRIKIQVSIDDFEKEHDENRGVPGLYRKALQTIRLLSERFRRKDPRFGLAIATCLTRTNKPRIGALHEYLRRELEFDEYQLLYPRGDAKMPLEKDVTPADYETAVEVMESRDIRRNHNPLLAAVNRMAKRGILKFLKTGERPWDCLGGKKFVSITEKGIVQPCEVLHQMMPEYDSDLGDLRDFDCDLRKLLDAPKARAVVQRIQEMGCCCSFECGANCNVVFQKTAAAGVLRAWLSGG